jgi:hypothetical protein
MASTSIENAIASDRFFERSILPQVAAVETDEIFMDFRSGSRKAHSQAGRGQGSLPPTSMPQMKIKEPAEQRRFRRKGTEGTFSYELPPS